MKKISRLILFMISLSVFAVGCSSDDDSSSFVDDNFASMPAGCESVDLRDIGTNGNNLYSMLQNEYTSFVTARCSISSSINAYTTGLESLGFSGFTGTLSSLVIHGAFIIRGDQSYEFFRTDSSTVIVGGGKPSGHLAVWGVGPASNAPTSVNAYNIYNAPNDFEDEPAEELTDGVETLLIGDPDATLRKNVE